MRMISFPSSSLQQLPSSLLVQSWHPPCLSPSWLIGEALQAWFMQTLTHSPTEYYSNQTPHYWKPASSGCLDRVITGYYTDHLHGHLQVISITLSYLQAHFLPHNICLIRLLCSLSWLQMESEVTIVSKVNWILTHPQYSRAYLVPSDSWQNHAPDPVGDFWARREGNCREKGNLLDRPRFQSSRWYPGPFPGLEFTFCHFIWSPLYFPIINPLHL